MHGYNKKTVKNPFNKRLTEDGPGSNYRTIDPHPISFFHDTRVAVEMFPTAWGKYGVEITCDDLGYDSGLRVFSDEEQMELWARNQYSSIISKLNSSNDVVDIVEAVLNRLLINVI